MPPYKSYTTILINKFASSHTHIIAMVCKGKQYIEKNKNTIFCFLFLCYKYHGKFSLYIHTHTYIGTSIYCITKIFGYWILYLMNSCSVLVAANIGAYLQITLKIIRKTIIITST